MLDFLQLPPPIYVHAACDPPLLLLSQELGTPNRKYPDHPHLFANISAEFASKAFNFQDSGEQLEKMKPSRWHRRGPRSLQVRIFWLMSISRFRSSPPYDNF